jgi:hypothetical protein
VWAHDTAIVAGHRVDFDGSTLTGLPPEISVEQ